MTWQSTTGRPSCDACKAPVTDTFYREGAHPGVHCDVCYRLVLLGLITPDGQRKAPAPPEGGADQ